MSKNFRILSVCYINIVDNERFSKLNVYFEVFVYCWTDALDRLTYRQHVLTIGTATVTLSTKLLVNVTPAKGHLDVAERNLWIPT
jgi:hypothetical protein